MYQLFSNHNRTPHHSYVSGAPVDKAATRRVGFYEDFLLGGVAAGVAKTAAAPIERVKLLIQNQDEMMKAGRLARPYEGLVDCTSRVVRDEGSLALWRGNTANVIRYFPTQALNFAFKDYYGHILKAAQLGTGQGKLAGLGGNMLSGALAGASSLVFVYSLDYVRTRLANDAIDARRGAARQFTGMTDVYLKTLQSDGIAGLYRGFVVSCVGIVVYRGCYFGFYDTLKPMLSEGMQKSLLATFLLGWAVTISAGLASYPFDTVRRRMMMTSGERVKYSGSWDCFMQILRNEGMGSLFKGAGANILRSVAGAGALAGFDKIKDMYIRSRYSQDTAIAIQEAKRSGVMSMHRAGEVLREAGLVVSDQAADRSKAVLSSSRETARSFSEMASDFKGLFSKGSSAGSSSSNSGAVAPASSETRHRDVGGYIEARQAALAQHTQQQLQQRQSRDVQPGVVYEHVLLPSEWETRETTPQPSERVRRGYHGESGVTYEGLLLPSQLSSKSRGHFKGPLSQPAAMDTARAPAKQDTEWESMPSATVASVSSVSIIRDIEFENSPSPAQSGFASAPQSAINRPMPIAAAIPGQPFDIAPLPSDRNIHHDSSMHDFKAAPAANVQDLKSGPSSKAFDESTRVVAAPDVGLPNLPGERHGCAFFVPWDQHTAGRAAAAEKPILSSSARSAPAAAAAVSSMEHPAVHHIGSERGFEGKSSLASVHDSSLASSSLHNIPAPMATQPHFARQPSNDMSSSSSSQLAAPDIGLPNLPGERHIAGFMMPGQHVSAPTQHKAAVPSDISLIAPPPRVPLRQEHHAAENILSESSPRSSSFMAQPQQEQPLGDISDVVPLPRMPDLRDERHGAAFVAAEPPAVANIVPSFLNRFQGSSQGSSLERESEMESAAEPPMPMCGAGSDVSRSHEQMIGSSYILSESSPRSSSFMAQPQQEQPLGDISDVVPLPRMPDLRDERHGAAFVAAEPPAAASNIATSSGTGFFSRFQGSSSERDTEMESPAEIAGQRLPDLRDERHGAAFIAPSPPAAPSSNNSGFFGRFQRASSERDSEMESPAQLPNLREETHGASFVNDNEPAAATIAPAEMAEVDNNFVSGTRSSPVVQQQSGFRASEDLPVENIEETVAVTPRVTAPIFHGGPTRKPASPVSTNVIKDDGLPAVAPSPRVFEPANISVPRNPASAEVSNQQQINAAVGHTSPSLGDKLLSATSKVKDAIVYALTGATSTAEGDTGLDKSHNLHPIRHEDPALSEREPPVIGSAVLPGGHTLHTADNMTAASDVQRAETLPPDPIRHGIISGSSKETGRSFTQMAKDLGQSIKETFGGNSASSSTETAPASSRRDNPPGREPERERSHSRSPSPKSTGAAAPPAMHRDYREACMEVSHSPGHEGEIVAPSGERAGAGAIAIQREGAMTSTHTNQAARSDADFARFHMFSPTGNRYINEEHIRKSHEPPVPPPTRDASSILGATQPGPTAFRAPSPVINIAVPNVRDPVAMAQAEQPVVGPTEFAEGPVAMGADVPVTTAAHRPGVGHNYQGGAAIDRELVKSKEAAAAMLVEESRLGEVRTPLGASSSSTNNNNNGNTNVSSTPDSASIAEPISVDYASSQGSAGPWSAGVQPAESMYSQPFVGSGFPKSADANLLGASSSSQAPLLASDPLLMSVMNPMGISSMVPTGSISTAGNLGSGPGQVQAVSRGSATYFGHGLGSLSQGLEGSANTPASSTALPGWGLQSSSTSGAASSLPGSGSANASSTSASGQPSSEENPRRFLSGSLRENVREGLSFGERTRNLGYSIKGLFSGQQAQQQQPQRTFYNPPPREPEMGFQQQRDQGYPPQQDQPYGSQGGQGGMSGQGQSGFGQGQSGMGQGQMSSYGQGDSPSGDPGYSSYYHRYAREHVRYRERGQEPSSQGGSGSFDRGASMADYPGQQQASSGSYGGDGREGSRSVRFQQPEQPQQQWSGRGQEPQQQQQQQQQQQWSGRGQDSGSQYPLASSRDNEPEIHYRSAQRSAPQESFTQTSPGVADRSWRFPPQQESGDYGRGRQSDRDQGLGRQSDRDQGLGDSSGYARSQQYAGDMYTRQQQQQQPSQRGQDSGFPSQGYPGQSSSSSGDYPQSGSYQGQSSGYQGQSSGYQGQSGQSGQSGQGGYSSGGYQGGQGGSGYQGQGGASDGYPPYPESIPVEHRKTASGWSSRFGVLGSTREPSRSFTQMAKDLGQSIKETFGGNSAGHSEGSSATSGRRDNPPAREPSPAVAMGASSERPGGAASPESPVITDYRVRELQVNTEPGREGEIVVPRTGERAGAGGIEIQRPHAVMEKTHTNQAARSDRADTTMAERDLYPADRPVIINKERVGNPLDWEGGNLIAPSQPITAFQVPNIRDPRFEERNLPAEAGAEPVLRDVVVTTALQQPGIGHNWHGGAAIDRELVAAKEVAAAELVQNVGREDFGRVQEAAPIAAKTEVMPTTSIASEGVKPVDPLLGIVPGPIESLSTASTSSLQGSSPSPVNPRTSPLSSSPASSSPASEDWSEGALGGAAAGSSRFGGAFGSSPLRKGGEYQRPFGPSQTYDTPALEGLGKPSSLASSQADNPIYTWQEPSYITERLGSAQGAEAIGAGLPSGLAAGQSGIGNTVDSGSGSGAMGGMNASGLQSRLSENLEAAGLQSMGTSGSTAASQWGSSQPSGSWSGSGASSGTSSGLHDITAPAGAGAAYPQAQSSPSWSGSGPSSGEQPGSKSVMPPSDWKSDSSRQSGSWSGAASNVYGQHTNEPQTGWEAGKTALQSGSQQQSSGAASSSGSSSGPQASSWSANFPKDDWPSASSGSQPSASSQWSSSGPAGTWPGQQQPANLGSSNVSNPLEPGQLSEKDSGTRSNILGSAREGDMPVGEKKGFGQRLKEVFTGHHHKDDSSASSNTAARDAGAPAAGAAAAADAGAAGYDQPQPIGTHNVYESKDTREHGMQLNMEPGREGEIIRPGTGERAGCGAICIQREGILEATHNSQAARADSKWISGNSLPADRPIVINRERTGSPPNYQDDAALAQDQPYSQVPQQVPPHMIPELGNTQRDYSGGSAIDRELRAEQLRAEERQQKFEADKYAPDSAATYPSGAEREATDTTRSHLSASTRSPSAPGLTFTEKLKDAGHKVKTALVGENKAHMDPDLQGNPSGDRNPNYEGLGLDRPANTDQRSYFDTKEVPLPPVETEGMAYDPVDPYNPETTRKAIIDKGEEPVIYPSLDAAPKDEHDESSVVDKLKDAGNSLRDAVTNAISGRGPGTVTSRQTSWVGSANSSKPNEASQATERPDVRHQLAHPEYTGGNPDADYNTSSITQRSSILGSARDQVKYPGLSSVANDPVGHSRKEPVAAQMPAPGPGIDNTRQEAVQPNSSNPPSFDMGPLGIQQRLVDERKFLQKEEEHDRKLREIATQDLERFAPPPAEEMNKAERQAISEPPQERPMFMEPTRGKPLTTHPVRAEPVRDNVDITEVQKEVPLDPNTDPLVPPEETPRKQSKIMEKLRETGAKVKEAIVVAFTGKSMDQNNALVPVADVQHADPLMQQKEHLPAAPLQGTTAMPAGQPAHGLSGNEAQFDPKKRLTLSGSSRDTSKSYRQMGEDALARMGGKTRSRSPGHSEDLEQGSMPPMANDLQRNLDFPPALEKTGSFSDPGEPMPIKVATREEAMHPNVEPEVESMLTNKDYAKQKRQLMAEDRPVPQEKDLGQAATEFLAEKAEKIRETVASAVGAVASRDSSNSEAGGFQPSESTRAALRAALNETNAEHNANVARPTRLGVEETVQQAKGEFAKDYLGNVARRTEGALKDAAYTARDKTERGLEAARDTAANVRNKAEHEWDVVKDKVEHDWEVAKDKAARGVDTARDKTYEAEQGLMGAGKRAMVHLREAGEELGEPIRPVVEKIHEELKDVGPATTDYLTREPVIEPEYGEQRAIGFEHTGVHVPHPLGRVTEPSEPVHHASQPHLAYEGADTEAQAMVPGLLGTLGGAVKNAFDAAVDALHNAKESAKETLHIGHPADVHLDNAAKSSRAAVEATRDAGVEAGRYIKGSTLEAWDKGATASKETARATSDAAKDAANRVSDKSREAWEAAKDKAAGAWDTVKETSKEALPDVSKSTEVDDTWKVQPSPAWEAAKAYAGAEVQRQAMAGKETWEGLKEAASEEWEGGKDALARAWDKAKELGREVTGSDIAPAGSSGSTDNTFEVERLRVNLPTAADDAAAFPPEERVEIVKTSANRAILKPVVGPEIVDRTKLYEYTDTTQERSATDNVWQKAMEFGKSVLGMSKDPTGRQDAVHDFAQEGAERAALERELDRAGLSKETTRASESFFKRPVLQEMEDPEPALPGFEDG